MSNAAGLWPDPSDGAAPAGAPPQPGQAVLRAEANGSGSIIESNPLLPAPAEATAPPPVEVGSLGRSTLLFVFSAIVSAAVSIFMLPLYTRYLTPADYGAIELVELSLDIATIVAGSRLLGGVFRFYYKATAEAERRAIISTGVWTVCGGYAIVGGLAFLAAPLLARFVLGGAQYTMLVRLGALSLATSAPTFVPTPYFRAAGRFRLIVASQLVRLGLQVSFNVLFLTVVHLGARAIFLSTIIANVAVGSVLLYLSLRDVGVQYVSRIAGDLYRFGLPLVASQVSTFVLTFGDRYFLRQAATLTVVGLYALSYRFAFTMASLAEQPFEMVWSPKRYEVAKRPDRDEIYARMFVYQSLMVLTLGVGMALFARSALQVLTTRSYWGAADVVPVLLAAMVLQAWAASQNLGIFLAERTKWVAVANWVGTAAVIAAYAVLIPRYAAWGAAIATLIGYAVRYLATYIKSQQLWPIHYEWKPIIRLCALAVAIVSAGFLLPNGPLALALVSRGGLFVLYLWLVWQLPILNPAEREGVRQLMRRLVDAVASVLGGSATERAVP